MFSLRDSSRQKKPPTLPSAPATLIDLVLRLYYKAMNLTRFLTTPKLREIPARERGQLTRKDMALVAISMNSAIAEKELQGLKKCSILSLIQ